VVTAEADEMADETTVVHQTEVTLVHLTETDLQDRDSYENMGK